ncbi:MAG: entericidin A/B family lipoprotein [Alphaproteobacteria bacterium]
MMKNLFLCTLFAVSVLSLGACSSTLDGAGQDIEQIGEKIQDTF